ALVERTIPAPERVAGRPSPRVLMPGRGRYSRAAYAWPIVAVAIVGLAVLFVVLTGARPAYDAYGWLVWGHQALRLKLDTNAAPSWKPLPFLFTFPYAVAGRGSVWAWMVTSTAAAFAAPIFAGRIAYRLAGTPPAPRWGGMLAAVFAGVAVLGL